MTDYQISTYLYTIEVKYEDDKTIDYFMTKTNDKELLVLNLFNFIKCNADYKIDTRNIGEKIYNNKIELEFINYKLDKEFYIKIYGNEKSIKTTYNMLGYLIEFLEKSNE